MITAIRLVNFKDFSDETLVREAFWRHRHRGGVSG